MLIQRVDKPNTIYYSLVVLNHRSIFSSRPNSIYTLLQICKSLNTQSKKILSLNATSAATSEDSNTRQTGLQRMKHCRNIRTFIQSASIVVLFAISSLPFQISLLMLVCGASIQIQTWTYIVSVFGVNAVNPYIYGVSDKTLRSAYKRNQLR